MSLTPEQIRAWRPHDLVEVATEWNSLADKLDQQFTDYHDALVRTADGGYWEGAAADAAQQAATDDRKHVGEATDAVRGLARLLNDNWYGIEAPLQRAKTALDALAREGFPVALTLPVADKYEISDNTMIGGKTWRELDAAKKAEIQQLLFDLTDGAAAARSANDALCNQLNTAAAGLPAQFTSAAALGSGQGKADAADLAAGTMSPDDIARLMDAGQLSPQQLARLESGGTATIPASQMQYLTELSRSLDGKTPQEIAQLTDKLPPDARQALANGLQIVSNERVDGGSAGKGTFERLPAKMRNSLTRSDLVEEKWTGNPPLHEVELNGVANNKAIASIVGAGDDKYKQGSTLDDKLLDVGRRYLDAQVKHEQNPNSKFEYFTVDGRGTKATDFTESIFSAVGGDKIAVESLVTNKEHGKDFVTDVLQHEWSDNGKAASTLFKFDDNTATVTDPNDAADAARATRSGHIMSKFAEYVGSEDAWSKLSNVPGHDNQSAGQLNPELLRTVSHSMSPYVSELAGGDHSSSKPGFNTDFLNKSTNYKESAHVFALMNTDPDYAGKEFNEAAVKAIYENEIRVAANPTDPTAGRSLATAGVLHGLVDKGLQIETKDEYGDLYNQDKAAYDRKNAAFELATGSMKFAGAMAPGPTGALVALPLDSFETAIKDGLLGEEPQPTDSKYQPGGSKSDADGTTQQSGLDRYRDIYAILDARQKAFGLSPNVVAGYEYALNPDGSLRSYEDVVRTGKNKGEDYAAMLSRLGCGSGSQIRQGYEDVMYNG